MPSNASLKAAREVVQSRARYARGLHRTASIATTQPLSLRAAATRHPGSSRTAIQRFVKVLETGNTPRQVGRPRLLIDEEEEAIVAFVIWMERSGFPASKPEIEDAATTLLQRRNPNARPVSKMWYTRFRGDHPELEIGILKESIKVLIVWTKQRSRKQVLSPSNRETYTVIGTGSAAGDTTPPWLVFKTFPTLD